MNPYDTRFNMSSQVSHMQARYVGTGHPDITKHEWVANQHRDSFASYIGHHTTLNYFALAENKSIGRKAYEFKMNMVRPCGPPPKLED